jgi:outer membrane receptor protein involved in Fe transport
MNGLGTLSIRKGSTTLLIALALILGFSGILQAQTSFGTIVGLVTDPTQAAVPGAAVTVTNTQTGVERQASTDESGNYRIGSLLPGIYNVKIEKSGFQLSQVAAVELRVTQTVTVNVVMQVGEITQTVDVTAAAPLLESSTSTVGTVVDNKSVVELPLNGRSFVDLILLVPGAVPRGKLFAISGGANYSVSGNSPDQNVYTLDGLANNEQFFKSFAIQPSIDAIQEFKVQTHVTSAEFGSGAGANVNIALKSGTNELHGSVFEFLRNDVLDANDFFRKASGINDKRSFRQNQYGGVVGGPVRIPGLYNGKDKAFWLFNYEGFKIRRESSNLATVPTAKLLSGDFTGEAPIYDPATRRPGPGGGLIADQFSCNGILNVICPDRINPATKSFADIMFPSTNVGGAANVINLSPYQLNQYQINIRGDYKATDKLSLFGRYSHYDAEEQNPQALPVVHTTTANKYRNAMLSLTYVPTPTLVFDYKVGVNDTNVFLVDSDPPPGAVTYLQQNPLQGTPIKDPKFPLYPTFGIPGYTGPNQAGVPLPVTDYQSIFNVSKIKGRHSLKFGFNYDNFRGSQDNFFTSSYAFSSVASGDPQNLANTGHPVASFLLGLPTGGTRNIGNTLVHMRWSLYAWYFQDDFKVSPKLTLNLGLRYEYDEVPRDRDDRLGQFDRVSGQFVWAGTNPVTGEPPNIERSILEPDLNNWAPRFGFAYQLKPKTTVRGGYSIFYGTNFLWESQGIRGQWPYALSDNLSGFNTAATLTPVQTLFSPDLDVTPGSTPSGIFALGRKDRTSYTQQWNLGVQHELAKDLLLEVNYVGTRGVKMPVFFTTNTPLPGPGDIQARRPFPQSTSLLEDNRKASGTYNGLQAKIDKRFSNGLQFLGSYAWSHQIDMGGNGNSDGATPQNEYDLKADRANGAFDFRHTFTGSYFYQFPFGKGRRFLTDASGVVNQIVSGWEVTGVTRYTTGMPVTVTIPFDNANTGTGGQRPDRVVGQPDRLPNAGDKTKGWLNPAAFAVAPQYRFGNLGRNTERGPGFGNWDIGFFKNFPLPRENTYIQFRTEFFNAFNNVNLAAPGATLGTPQFGQIFSTTNRSREIQFALKVLF